MQQNASSLTIAAAVMARKPPLRVSNPMQPPPPPLVSHQPAAALCPEHPRRAAAAPEARSHFPPLFNGTLEASVNRELLTYRRRHMRHAHTHREGHTYVYEQGQRPKRTARHSPAARKGPESAQAQSHPSSHYLEQKTPLRPNALVTQRDACVNSRGLSNFFWGSRGFFFFFFPLEKRAAFSRDGQEP